MKKKIFIAAAVFFSSYAQAQQDTTGKALDEIVVTATKFEVKQSQTGKVVSVIDQATLQRNIGKSLPEILNYQAGIFINGANNALGTNSDIYLRGAGSGNTLILIDGVPVGDPSQINSSFDLNSINPNQVERIEILKGAQSTLWGSDAVAGVINIITKKGGDKKLAPNASIAYGSYNTLKAAAGIGGKIDKLTYNLNYNYIKSDGFSSAYDSTGSAGFDKDGFKQNSIQANIGYKISSQFSVSAFSNYGKYNADVDNGAFSDDKDYTATNSNFINSLEIEYKYGNSLFRFTNTLITAKRISNNDTTADPKNGDYSRRSYKGNSFVSELYGNIGLAKKISLTTGVQRTQQNTDQSNEGYSRDYSFGYSSTLGKDSAKATNYAAYASLILTGLKNFNAEAGLRYNHHSTYGNNSTYSFNPSFNIDNNTRVFVNISSAFKTPSLYQLYSEYGNKDLKPEKSNNFELGVQALSNNKNNSLRLVAFKRDIKNVIIFYTDANYVSSYINRDTQHDYGFEIESNIAIGNMGIWVNNFTYVDGEGEDGNIKVKNLYRRPNFTFNSALTLTPVKGLTLMPSFRFVGSRVKGEYDPGPYLMPQYYTVDFYASYNFIKQVKIFTDFRNITNQKYFDIPGYNSRRANYTIGVSANF